MVKKALFGITFVVGAIYALILGFIAQFQVKGTGQFLAEKAKETKDVLEKAVQEGKESFLDGYRRGRTGGITLPTITLPTIKVVRKEEK